MTLPLPTFPDLDGKVAVVTGGSRGIGATTCNLLAASGATVVVNSRVDAAIAALVTGIRSDGGQVIGTRADGAAFAAIERMRHQVEREVGPVEVLAALAGGSAGDTPAEQRVEEKGFVIAADLIATFLTVRSFLPGMIERRSGLIVTLPTVAVFSRHVAKAVRMRGIRVHCLTPAEAAVAAMERLGRIEDAVPSNTLWSSVATGSEVCEARTTERATLQSEEEGSEMVHTSMTGTSWKLERPPVGSSEAT